MPLSVSSFAIAALGLLVAIISFIFGERGHPRIRLLLGVPFLLLALLFSLIGFFSFFGDTSSTATPAPLTGVQTGIPMPAAPLYDDFEGAGPNLEKWGPPIWGNPQTYTPTQSNGILRFELTKDWIDWAVKQPQTVQEMHALITLDNSRDGAFGISLGRGSTRYNLMLRGDSQVITWDAAKELDLIRITGTCCPYTHILGAKTDGEQIHFYVDNQMVASYSMKGYPDYVGLQIVGASWTVAYASEVWIAFGP